MSNLTEAELLELVCARTEVEWDAICDRIKAARDDRYPPDWYAQVLASGLMTEVCKRWKVRK